MKLVVIGIDKVMMGMMLGVPLLRTTGDDEHVMFASLAFESRGRQRCLAGSYNRSRRLERWGEGDCESREDQKKNDSEGHNGRGRELS